MSFTWENVQGPFPFNHTASEGKLGEGLGTRLRGQSISQTLLSVWSPTQFQPIPQLDDEPLWMKRSTVCPVAAGTAIIRDPRAWHGGTPNLSNETRCMPNVEYYASWYRFRDHTQQMTTSMPREVCLIFMWYLPIVEYPCYLCCLREQLWLKFVWFIEHCNYDPIDHTSQNHEA